MSKTSQKTIPEFMNIPWSGVTGFHTDIQTLEQQQAALEALNAKPKTPTAGSLPDGGECETTVIYKKDGAYHVYFHVSELVSDWGVNLASFSMWLSSLQENESVCIHQTGNTSRLTNIVQILGVFATECKAKKIFVVDHPIENALFLMVCDEIIYTSTGAITFSNNLNIDRNKWDLIYTPYLKSLFAKAVEKKLLTKDEVTAIIDDNAIIFKTYKQLAEQGAVT